MSVVSLYQLKLSLDELEVTYTHSFSHIVADLKLLEYDLENTIKVAMRGNEISIWLNTNLGSGSFGLKN